MRVAWGATGAPDPCEETISCPMTRGSVTLQFVETPKEKQFVSSCKSPANDNNFTKLKTPPEGTPSQKEDRARVTKELGIRPTGQHPWSCISEAPIKKSKASADATPVAFLQTIDRNGPSIFAGTSGQTMLYEIAAYCFHYENWRCPATQLNPPATWRKL